MSTGSIALIARRSIRARVGRLIAIALAILVGVSFVVGSFVLADSLRKTFSDLFTQISENVDLEARSVVAFEQGQGTQERDPIGAELADQIAGVEGVAAVEPLLLRYAQLVDKDGEAITTQGAPTYGTAWAGDASLSGLQIKGEGRPPDGPGEVAIDAATADRANFDVGDPIEVITDIGRATYTITALVGLGDSNGFAGATLAAWDVPTAASAVGAGAFFDGVDIAVAEGTDVAAVQFRLDDVLPDDVEVVTREVLIAEGEGDVDVFINAFQIGLLVFAFITAFVSAFLINNVFQITIGQRLRELALLRAVGASGDQVRRMIYTEALMTSIVATALGIGGGILVARGLLGLFNAAGVGFPDASTVLTARTVIVAVLVGIGITMLSVVVPARRAARIPPVAAMRPELGFDAMRTRRLVAGTVVTVVGAASFAVGLFLRPGGTIGLAALAGAGALLLFLGVASVSATVARPVTRAIGWPVNKLLGTPGALARENAGRAPRRTSSTAAALMIGVALVSAAAVFAASLRSTFGAILERAVQADYLVTDESFQGLPPGVADALAGVPEVSAVTPIRITQALIGDEQRGIGAVNPAAIEQLIDLDLREGSYADLADGGVLVNVDPARELDLAVGDDVPVTFQNGTTLTLSVAGIYADSSLAGGWITSLDTLGQVSSDATTRDLFVVAKLADGVEPAAGDAAIKAAVAGFPQAQVQTNAEFRRDQEGQIDQLLLVITVLLAFAIIIAVLGISITLGLGVVERTREIGLMRAVGMNRRQMRRSVRWEAVIVSTFGALVGIVVGTVIGALLALAVPDDVIDRLALSPLIIVAILVGAVIAGLVAALYPSAKASRMDILRAIATE
ncbi:MAG: ABC transporter permease [Ilumatobacteraceae bacterium]